MIETGRRLAAIAVLGLALSPTGSAPAEETGGFTRTHPDSLRWAYVLRSLVARSAPSINARPRAIVRPATGEGESNLLLALAERRNPDGRDWVRVRLGILPNGSTGWVPRNGLGDFHVVRTRLVVNRSSLTAVLYRGGRVIFRTVIGIGRPGWPTPAGEFYVRERLAGFGQPFYGPVAFGTSARSPTLTDWPGGGYIGIHGTDSPGLLPGRVSHGCIRMRNGAILRLSRLMPLGTPLTVL